MCLGFLAALGEDWQPVSKVALTCWLVFYGVFLLYALTSQSGFLLIDYVFVPIHEGGHLLFGWFGPLLGVLGGTFLQLLAPLAVALYFAFHRHLAGTAFAAFFFFENFLNVSTYMADARRQALQYVTVGEPEYAEHDWFVIFSRLGLLERDTLIAGVVRTLGWLGMLGVVGWLVRAARAGQIRLPPDEGGHQRC